ncbi:hypothetical protein V8E36_009558 [Tilletia maclaganii]
MTSNLSPASAELIKLITSATTTIEHCYTSHGQPLPHLRPSSASDIGSDGGPGTLPSAEFIQAVQLLQGATTQLLAQLTPPPVYGAQLALASLDSAALGILINGQVADVIHKHDPDAQNGVPIDTIAKDTNLEPRHLSRIMRSLSTKHIFVEVKPDIYANNRQSSTLRSDTEASCVNVFGHWVHDIMPSSVKLPEVMADSEHVSAYSVAHSGAARAFGSMYWDFLKSQPERGRRFNEAMKELTNKVSFAESVYEDVPWADDFGARNQSGVFVDVGAGAGHQALSIASKLPGWQFVIEDLPEVVSTSAKELWETKGAKYDYRLVPQNFFESQAVQGADVYYMKHIIHDWPDKECVTILKHLRNAADVKRTRLMIADIMIEPATPSDPSRSPLLSNSGAGANLAHKADMVMMTALEAQERTRSEFEDNVIRPAGWKLAKVHSVRSHLRLVVLECVPV